MAERNPDAFLSAAGWASARRSPLAGDASARRYLRLDRDGATAVLMDADPSTGETTGPFLRIARHLSSVGLSAPAILAADPDQGFVLMEDLGDALFAREIAADPTLEVPLYAAAAEMLVHLHQTPPPAGLVACTPAHMAGLIQPYFDHFAPGRPDRQRLAVTATLQDALDRHAAECTVLILRDFHAENLIWLPERRRAARCGLLDFQDAMLGHVAYDLASMITDARRDVTPAGREAAIGRYLELSRGDQHALAASIAVHSVQRNLRILGIFARLATTGKPGYLRLVPRVAGHLRDSLGHPALRDVADALGDPAPEVP